MLEMQGWARISDKLTADVIIFQTCSIRDTAARKVLTHISQAKVYRRENQTKQTLCVIGCITAHEEIKGVDIVLGTNQLEVLVEKLCGVKPDTSFGLDNSIIITHGCENFCAYCIVPYARGKEWSRDIDEITKEFTDIKDKTNKVIYLLGQNVNSYRCPRTGTDFVGLLDKLCGMEGEFVLNFMSSHPKDFDERVVDCIARNKNIERNIHLPMQSGCDKILKAMGRIYSINEYISKVELLRAKVDGVRVTTDIICGFPGESEEDFKETVEVVKRLKFNSAFIYPFSRRKGTVADTMPNQIDRATIKQRTNELIEINRTLASKRKV